MATKQNNESFGPTSPGVARDSFFLFFLFFILLVEFNSVPQKKKLRFLKTPASAAHTTARVHTGSQVKSGPVSRSNGVPQCAIVRSIRTRTTSHDLARPRRALQETQACYCQVSKKVKKSKQIQKNERKSFWTLAAVTSQCRIIGKALQAGPNTRFALVGSKLN